MGLNGVDDAGTDTTVHFWKGNSVLVLNESRMNPAAHLFPQRPRSRLMEIIISPENATKR